MGGYRRALLLTMALLSACAHRPRASATAAPTDRAGLERDCRAGLQGQCYNLGLLVKSEPQRAKALFERACERGVPDACMHAAAMYEHGEGTPKDEPRALRIYERICNDRSTMGCNNLGLMVGTGRGIKADEARATTLFQRACEQN